MAGCAAHFSERGVAGFLAVSASITGDGEAVTAAGSALARKLGRFAPLAPDELAALAALEAERRPVAAGTELVREREPGQRAFILRDRRACCYQLLPDGGRQVIDVRLPGDFVGLRSAPPRAPDPSAAAVTDAVVAEV